MFVQPDQVELVADRFQATPFDVKGAVFGHRADKCTFDAMLDHFDLHTNALTTLADVVRAADLGKLSENPQAAGLQAVSLGLSRLHKDDTTQLEAGLVIYDAFYLWARDAQTEKHDGASHGETS